MKDFSKKAWQSCCQRVFCQSHSHLELEKGGFNKILPQIRSLYQKILIAIATT
jgi:hypothetical protein